MSCIVVHNQLICVFEHLRKVRRCLTIGVNLAGNGYSLAATTHADDYPPNIQLRIFRGNKQNRRRVPRRFRLVQQSRVHTIECWLLLAQVVISSFEVPREPFRITGPKLLSNS